MSAKKLAFGLVAVASLVLVGAAAAVDCGHCPAGHSGACMGKGECPVYDAKTTTTFQATVVGIEKEACEGCKMTHVDLVVKTTDGKMTVRLGPAWYMDKQQELFKSDDVVEIFASKVKHGDDDLFVAGTIKKGDDVLMLRDKEGFPMWSGWRRGKV